MQIAVHVSKYMFLNLKLCALIQIVLKIIPKWLDNNELFCSSVDLNVS